MVKIEFMQPNVESPFGTFKVDIGFPVESYNYPLSFKVISDVSNELIWETNNMMQGHWSSSGSPNNCTAYLIDTKGNIIDKLVWETFKHGDYAHTELLKWALKNKGAKGIAIGTHDGATGEWVVPVRDGLIEGFLVEASDMQFNLLSENYKDIKNAHIIQSLVTKDGQDCEFYEGPDGYTNSVKKSHLSIFTDDIRTVKMKSISLNDLIINCGLKDDLKWLHLDVEGIDDELIMSLDDSRIRLPEIIIYETLNLDDERKKKVTEWLQSKQYSCTESGWNTVAISTKADLSLLIHTCDHYEKFWAGMFYTLDFYWDYDHIPVYFANEEKNILDIKYNTKANTEYRPDKRIKQILTGKTDRNGFSTRFIEAVKKIPTKYVLYMQEDMWLKRSLDTKLIDELIKFMDENKADSIRIHAKLFYYDTYNLEPTEHIICRQRLLKTKGPSFLSHNATIWRKDYILKYQVPGEDPWINEEKGSERMLVDCDNHYHYNIHWYCQPGISDNGEFSQEAVVYGHIVDEMKGMELKLNLKGTNDF